MAYSGNYGNYDYGPSPLTSPSGPFLTQYAAAPTETTVSSVGTGTGDTEPLWSPDPPLYSPQTFTKPSLHAAPSFSARTSRFEYARRFATHQWWLLECASLVTSLGLFGLYFALLILFKDQPAWKWPEKSALGLSLNSVVSLVATVMRGCMLFAVSCGLGQLKWHYFDRKPRGVDVMERVDRASRGFVGSVRLFFSTTFLPLACIGAAIMILSLFNSAVVQASVRTTLGSTTNITNTVEGMAGIPVANSYDRYVQGRSRNLTEVTATQFRLWPIPRLITTLNSAWYYLEADASVTETYLPNRCKTGNCRFQDMATLAVDYECKRANDLQVLPDEPRPFYFSKSANISNWIYIQEYDNMFYTHVLTRPKFEFFEASQLNKNVALIVQLSGIGTASSPEDLSGTGPVPLWEAVECSLYWVVRRVHEVKVVDFGVQEPVSDLHIIPDIPYELLQETNITFTPDWKTGCTFTDYNNTESTESCSFTVDWQAHLGIQLFFQDWGWNRLYYYIDTEHGETDRWWSEDDSAATALYQTARRTGNFSRSFEAYVELLSIYMSNNVRLEAGQWVFGEMSYSELYFDIRRLYAAFPAALLILSTLFFVAVMWHTRREPIWKNSQLPLLYHGFAREEQAVNDLRTLADMRDVAEQQKVQLTDVRDGAGLRLRDPMGTMELRRREARAYESRTAVGRQWNGREQRSGVDSVVYSSAMSTRSRDSVAWQQGGYAPVMPHSTF